MVEFFRALAGAILALGRPWASKKYLPLTQTPFRDDRKNLATDWLRVEQDMSRSVSRVTKEDTTINKQ